MNAREAVADAVAAIDLALRLALQAQRAAIHPTVMHVDCAVGHLLDAKDAIHRAEALEEGRKK